jgi:hypothetical protein
MSGYEDCGGILGEGGGRHHSNGHTGAFHLPKDVTMQVGE